MIKNITEQHQWKNVIQNWITTSIYAVVLCYFITRLIDGYEFSALSFAIKISLLCAILGLSVIFWKISLPIIGIFTVILIFQKFTHFSVPVPFISLSNWKDLGQDIIKVIKWLPDIIKANPTVPDNFEIVLIIFITLISAFTNWLLPIPLLNIFFLIVPLFYMHDIAGDPLWLLYLLLGLFCVYSSYAYRQDPTNREQRPPIIFGIILIALTFVLQFIVQPEWFFNEKLSKLMNSHIPQDGGEIVSFSLEELGFYPQGNLRIGGKVELSDDNFMTIIAPPESFYLRGSSYDSFDGHAWGLSKHQILSDYTWDEDYYNDFSSYQAKTFWYDSAKSRDLAIRESIVVPMAYSIKTEAPTRIVFHGGKPAWINKLSHVIEAPADQNHILTKYNDGGKFLFSENGMLVSGRTYEENGVALVDHVVPVLNTWSTKTNKMPLELLPAKKKTGEHKYKDLVEKYDPRLAELIYGPEIDTNLLIKSLRYYMDTAYKYSLDVPDIPSDVGFMEHFLNTKTGYCVYFATLWTELLKDMGYEARYCEGFVVPRAPLYSDKATERVLDANMAHAWVEIYLDGFGWYPIETTPTDHITEISGVTPNEYRWSNSPDEESSEPETSSESINSESEESSGQEESNTPNNNNNNSNNSDDSNSKNMITKALIAVGIFALAALLFVIYVIKKLGNLKKRLNRKHIENYSGSLDLLARRLWKHIKRLNDLLGTPVLAEDTIKDLVDKYAPTSPEESKDEIVEILEKLYYGNIEPNSENCLLLHDYYTLLENKVKEKYNGISWLIKDVLSVSDKSW